MKGTEQFKEAIKNHLRLIAKGNPLFLQTLKKENKNIDDCITYILNQVKASNCVGFENDEIYKMAVHYYDEDEIEVGKPITEGEIKIHHQVELSAKEIEELKHEARQKVIAEETARLTKPVTSPKGKIPAKTEEKEAEVPQVQGSLF